MKLTDKLLELNIDIPKAIPTLGSYVPYKIIENFIYVSGQLPIDQGSVVSQSESKRNTLKTEGLISGKVPSQISIDQAKKAAELCVLNSLPLLVTASNNTSFDTISCISISGFINSDNNFQNHPEIINGASELIFKIFGDNGKHSRIAVGCNSLPKNACVEISSIFHIKR